MCPRWSSVSNLTVDCRTRFAVRCTDDPRSRRPRRVGFAASGTGTALLRTHLPARVQLCRYSMAQHQHVRTTGVLAPWRSTQRPRHGIPPAGHIGRCRWAGWCTGARVYVAAFRAMPLLPRRFYLRPRTVSLLAGTQSYYRCVGIGSSEPTHASGSPFTGWRMQPPPQLIGLYI
jgi:hypothetical protein